MAWEHTYEKAIYRYELINEALQTNQYLYKYIFIDLFFLYIVLLSLSVAI